MTAPVLNVGTSRVWICDRNPNAEEPLANIEVLNFWFNTQDIAFFICSNASNPSSLVWKQIALATQSGG